MGVVVLSRRRTSNESFRKWYANGLFITDHSMVHLCALVTALIMNTHVL
jgi:hypothetical protein